MKKSIVSILICLLLYSCGDEVQFNTPAFQGDRQNELWRAQSFSASIAANGFLTITGSNNFETVNLRLPTTVEGRYVTGAVDLVEAEYIDAFDTRFSTNNRPDPSVSVYEELGEIVIEEVDLNNRTFTGTFRFLAFDASGTNSIGYTNGIFFRVPLISGEIPTDPLTCADVEMELDAAFQAFQAASSPDLEFISSSVYEETCSAYIASLNSVRAICENSNPSTTSIIENLGNCQITCEQATDNRVEAESQYIAATIGNFNEKCDQYVFYLQEQIDFCGDEIGLIQEEIDRLDCADADGDGVPNVFEDFNGDGDKENDDIDGDGIPNYLDDDDDGDGVLTQFEAQDAEGNPTDTNGDGQVDYLDDDDDGDGILTRDENPDPNGDGNPQDAIDSDGNGIPDYLQA